MAALLLFFYDTVEQEDFPFLLTAQKFCVTFLYCYLLVPIFLLLKKQSQSYIISDFCFKSLPLPVRIIWMFFLIFPSEVSPSFYYRFSCMAFCMYTVWLFCCTVWLSIWHRMAIEPSCTALRMATLVFHMAECMAFVQLSVWLSLNHRRWFARYAKCQTFHLLVRELP